MNATRIIGGQVMGWVEITRSRAAYVVVRNSRPLRFPDGKSAAWEVDHDAGIIRMNPSVTDREAERDLDFIVQKARETLPPRRRRRREGGGR